MKDIKRLNFEHILVHITFFGLAGIVYGYGIYMMLERGFDQATAGLCFSLTNVICLVLQPTISNFLDNTKRVTLLDMLLIEASILAFLFFCNMFITSKSLMLAVIVVCFGGLYTSLEPLVNSISTKLTYSGIPCNFETARAIGSASYGVVCALFGILSDLYSYKAVLIGGFVISLLLALAIYIIRKDFNSLNIKEEVKVNERLVSFKEFIKNHTNYILLCACLAIVFCGYTGIDNFMIVVCENVGGSSSDLGINLAFKALAEVIGMALFAKLVKKIKLEKLLSFAAISFCAKAIVTYMAKDMLAVHLSQVFQVCSFGFIMPGMIALVSKKMNKHEIVRGVAFFTMSIGLGSMLSSTIAGVISDNYGVSIMELSCFIITVLGTFGYLYLIKKQ